MSRMEWTEVIEGLESNFCGGPHVMKACRQYRRSQTIRQSEGILYFIPKMTVTVAVADSIVGANSQRASHNDKPL